MTSTIDRLVSIRLAGRPDRGVETSEEIDALVAAGAPVALAVSGGKDSCAQAIATTEHLDAAGHVGERVLIHADLGRVEWQDSLPTCERLAVRLGLELIIARRAAGDMMDRWLVRWQNNVRRYMNLECVRLILPWSTPSMRFCTSELKSAPMASVLVRRFPGRRIISACGVRRDESSQRRRAETWKENPRLTRRSRGTSGVDWNPIAAWTEADVYRFLEDRGFPLHEGYARYGMSRISCVNCIMAKEADLRASVTCEDNHAIHREMVELEATSTFAFQGARWLGDVAPEILGEDLHGRVADAKRRAARRVEVESRIPKHLLYTKGWPTVMPTADEARMLCDVRIAIGGLIGIDPLYTQPDLLIARYAELMAIGDAKSGHAHGQLRLGDP